VRWRYDAPGRISGAPTIVGRGVYFSDLDSRSTTGLDVGSGHRVFHKGTGKFNPIISDGKRMYLTGFSTIYTLVPKKAHAARAGKPKHKRRKKRR
jgi:hypothetical protein